MLFLLAIATSIAHPYFESLKKDLAKQGFESIVLIASISWIGSPIILAALVFSGNFQLPSDPVFYLLWVILAFLTCIQFTLFLFGLERTEFQAATSYSSLEFVATAIYAIVFLHEQLSLAQALAIIIAALGAVIFFDLKSTSKRRPSTNLGLVAILCSIFLVPLGGILYKLATFHTSSYMQFVSGRVAMDILCYSLFLFFFFRFWLRRNPLLRLASLVSNSKGATYMIGLAVVNLLDSWLIFKLPVTVFTVLATVSIPTGFVIGGIKYKETFKASYVVGALFISLAIVLFTFRDIAKLL